MSKAARGLQVLPILLTVVLAGPVSAGPVQELLQQRSEAEQGAILAEAVRSAGFACGAVSHILYRGDNPVDDSAYYAVRCTPGGDYNLRIENGGNMRSSAMSCDILSALGEDCWSPF